MEIRKRSEKEEKIMKLKDATIEHNNCYQKMNINNILNVDCLVYIFECLEYQDRLNIEFVCKRWYQVGKLSWTDVKSLKLNNKMKSKYLIYPDNEENCRFIIKIIRRASNFLNNICIKNCFDIDYVSIFKEIILNCKNINSLSINAFCNTHTRICREEDLSLLFKNNKNLSRVYISGIYTVGECLQYLRSSCLNYLRFDFTSFVCEDYFSSLSNFKNLKESEILIINGPYEATNALINKECENINGLTVYLYDNKCPLSSLICKQKLLSKLCIKASKVDLNFLETLPKTLKHLEIITDENGLSCLHSFKNLINFAVWIEDLTDQSIKYLTNCLALKQIKIYLKNISNLTLIGEDYFKLFQGVERLDLFNLNSIVRNLDGLLLIISKLKSLKYLSIPGFKFTEKGVSSICLILNLQKLDISFTKICMKQVIKIADKLFKLRKLNLKQCANVNDNIFVAINTLKLNRGDKNILKICFGGNIMLNNVNVNLKKLHLISFNDITNRYLDSY